MKSYTINPNDTIQIDLILKQISQYEQEQFLDILETSKKINAIYPCQVLVHFSEHDKKKYYEHAEIKTTYKENIYTIQWQKYNEKFVVYADFLKTLKNINNYSISSIKNTIKEPQKIGVLNKKKLFAWFEYYLTVYEQAKKIDTKNGKIKEDFLKSIEDLPIEWIEKGKVGHIVKNGINYHFTIHEEGISQNINIHYSVSNTLDNFIKLSDNKL